MKSKFDRLKGLYYAAITIAYGLFEMIVPSSVQAAEYSGADNYSATNKNIGDYATSLADIIMIAVLAIAFVAGAAMVVMGLVGFAQKRDNPEAAQGAPRKLMAGGALLAITVIIGILRATLKSAG